MFSVPQRAEFFPLRDHAWKAWASANGKDAKDGKEKDKWYRELMVRELGVYSSKELCPKDDYCTAMAVMEAIAGGSYFWKAAKPKAVREFELGRMYWNLRATQTETARRYLHAIRQLCREHELEEDYVRETARRIGQLDSRPIIEHLKSPTLWKLLAALRIYVNRDRPSEEEPF